MATRVSSLSCPNCGAQLRWNGEVNVVECRYCQTHVAVKSGTRTDRPTEAISVPPARQLGGIVAGLLLVGIVGSLSIVMMTRGRSASTASSAEGTPTSGVAELAVTPLAATVAQVAERHHVPVHGKMVSIKLKDAAFAQVDLSWDEAHPEHVSSIVLWPHPKAGERKDVITRARQQLGRRLRLSSTGGYQFSTHGLYSSFGENVQLGVHDFTDPAWKARLAAMWAVAKHAAFGSPLVLDAETRRDVLDLGYPLTLLTQIPFDLDVDGAAATMQRLAPNGETDGPRFRLRLDHPWFESASLDWKNEPGGVWSGLTLHFPVESTLLSLADALTTCMSPLLGEPKRFEADHLAGTFTLQYPARGGRPWIDLGSTTFSIRPHYNFGDPGTAAGLAAVLSTLIGCTPAAASGG